MSRTDRRWPGWVYDTGEEPDYRFSFANERTFLAWVRTALALIAGGVALGALDVSSIDRTVQRLLTTTLVALGIGCALTSWWRWASAERAIRRGDPLPAAHLVVILPLATSAIALAVLFALG